MKQRTKEILRKIGLEEFVDKVDQDLCPFCGEKTDVSTFRDSLSLREFTLSGLCQKCQDEIFNIQRR